MQTETRRQQLIELTMLMEQPQQSNIREKLEGLSWRDGAWYASDGRVVELSTDRWMDEARVRGRHAV